MHDNSVSSRYDTSDKTPTVMHKVLAVLWPLYHMTTVRKFCECTSVYSVR